jgi:hypothetical protein
MRRKIMASMIAVIIMIMPIARSIIFLIRVLKNINSSYIKDKPVNYLICFSVLMTFLSGIKLWLKLILNLFVNETRNPRPHNQITMCTCIYHKCCYVLSSTTVSILFQFSFFSDFIPFWSEDLYSGINL